jgi:hypothetical protein
MTISLFILSGAELAAQMHFQGPLGINPEQDINSGDLQSINEFDSGKSTAAPVPFLNQLEHLN